jgi:hypothetical protein
MPSLLPSVRFVRRVFATAVLMLAVLASSCAPGRKPVFPVRGQVLDARKKPAAGALVVFHPLRPDPKDAARPVGRVGEDGKFALTTYTEGDGAPVGEYAITITWPAAKKTPFDPEGPDQLSGRYSNPERSSLRFTVEKHAENEVPLIHLE